MSTPVYTVLLYCVIYSTTEFPFPFSFLFSASLSLLFSHHPPLSHMMADLQGMWPPVTSLPADFQMEERERSWRMELKCSRQPECLVVCREKGREGGMEERREEESKI